MGELARLQRRHPHKALTAQTVSSLRPFADRVRRVADGNGLYLVIKPNGAKSWILRTVTKGRRCDIGLGGLKTVPLAIAREDAERLRRLARRGGDPLAAHRHEVREVPTFKEAVDEVHGTHAEGFTNAKHSKQWLASLSTALNAFGARRVDALESADVLAVLKPIWLAKPETARRVLQRITTVLDWCRAQGHRTGDNPAKGIADVLPKHRTTQTHHAALPYQRVNAFLRELQESDAGEPVKLAFEFTILCASRTSETLNATWDEIDLESKSWTIPALRMKARVDHRVPLTGRCIAILERAKALSNGGPFLFPSRRKSKPLSNMVFLMTLRRMEYGDITAHGFRSSFRDWTSERTNFPQAVCEAALAHTVRNKTEAAYNRTDLFERRRELMDTWAAFVAAKAADVVPIRA